MWIENDQSLELEAESKNARKHLYVPTHFHSLLAIDAWTWRHLFIVKFGTRNKSKKQPLYYTVESNIY
jgi:hypothetical protein